jgi:hypothetical protein
MQQKVWDITQPTDNWSKGYAKLEYEATGLRQLFSRRIEVDQIYVCFFCGKLNNYYVGNCEQCDWEMDSYED